MSKSTHYTVVRNQGYSAKEFKTRQRHNERQNENYFNGDIIPERSALNITYRQCVSPDGTPESYEQSFNRMIDSGEIVKRGLKPDAKVFAELVFDVNTAYFDENGGYEFAKKFYDEVYKLAVKEVGDERYILSAVMHADERNMALSDDYGRDIFHYHVHVIYIPVVEKKCYYRKDMKDKTKAGKLKEIIPQISHSKKWPIKTPVEKNGKTYQVNSYSLLQDRYYEHMLAAGFDGFERGERGSTAEHLDVLDFKIKQDAIKAEKQKTEIAEMQEDIIELDKELGTKEAKLDRLDRSIIIKEKARATIKEINKMGKPALLGGYTVTADEMKKLKTLAKKSVTADNDAKKAIKKIEDVKNQWADRCRQLDTKISYMQRTITSISRDRDTWKLNYERLWDEVKGFIWGIRNIPQQLKAFIDHFRHERNQHIEEAQKAKKTDVSL